MTKTIGTDLGVKYATGVLAAVNMGASAFAEYCQGKNTMMQSIEVLRRCKDVPGLELHVSALLKEMEPQPPSSSEMVPREQGAFMERVRSEASSVPKPKPKRDQVRTRISEYLRGQFNQFRPKSSSQLPPSAKWGQVMDELGVELVIPEGFTFEEIAGPSGEGSRKRKRADEARILIEIEKEPPTIYLKRKGQDRRSEESESIN